MKEGKMNINEIRERTIELTEKDKIYWKKNILLGKYYRQAKYHGIKLWTDKYTLFINEVAISCTHGYLERLHRAIDKQIDSNHRAKYNKKKLQEADDILRG